MSGLQKAQEHLVERDHQIDAALKILRTFVALHVHKLPTDHVPSLRKPLFELHHAALKALSEASKQKDAKYSARFESDK
jgi:hypothetical protein